MVRLTLIVWAISLGLLRVLAVQADAPTPIAEIDDVRQTVKPCIFQALQRLLEKSRSIQGGFRLANPVPEGRFSAADPFVGALQKMIGRYKIVQTADGFRATYGGKVVELKGSAPPTVHFDGRSWPRTIRGLKPFRKGQYSMPEEVLFSKEMVGKRFLDLGTGSGNYVRDLRELGVEAYGLDLFIDLDQLSTGYFLPGDAMNTGLPAGSFSFVSSRYNTFYSSPDAIIPQLREMKRLCDHGGTIMIDGYTGNFSELKRALRTIGGLTLRNSGREWDPSNGAWAVITKE